jgi:hypothetical protein
MMKKKINYDFPALVQVGKEKAEACDPLLQTRVVPSIHFVYEVSFSKVLLISW